MDNPRPAYDPQEKEKELVRVKWVDIISHADWTTHDKVSCPAFESIGWLVHRDEKEIKIATTLDRHDGLGENDGEDAYYGITAFPSGCVLECLPLHSHPN
jgi:hypothetical protein|tara:strand:- start:5859 stop:6158 length:300 start_codon:yes stop_codon:yes gene_type:complete